MLSVLALTLSLSPAAFADHNDSDADVIEGATNVFDYVYTDEDNTVDRSDQAEDFDKDPVTVFGDEGSSDQYLYMGLKTKFDKVFFIVTLPAEYEGVEKLSWQYNDGGSWKTLSVTDAVDAFTNRGVATLSFSLPSDWDSASYQSKTAYWIRVKPDSDVERPALVEQISVRGYNVKVNVEDEDGDEVDDLTSSDFSLSNGSDNQVYAFKNLGDGAYEFALQGEGSDDTYVMKIEDSRYKEESFSIGSVTSSKLTYNVELDEKSSSSSSDDDDDSGDDEDCDMPFVDLDDHWAETEVEDLYCRGIVKGRSYYYYEPDDEVTRAEFLKMILLNADVDMDDYEDESESFDDVSKNDWFQKYVIAGAELGVIDDDEDDFRPNDEINRAEAVTMLVRLADEPTNSSNTVFSDVSSSKWYAKYVDAAYDDDVVDGYSDDTFRPSNNLTRAEAAVMVDNAFEAWYE